MDHGQKYGTLVIPLWTSAPWWLLITKDGRHPESFVLDWMDIPQSANMFIPAKPGSCIFSGRPNYRVLALRVSFTHSHLPGVCRLPFWWLQIERTPLAPLSHIGCSSGGSPGYRLPSDLARERQRVDSRGQWGPNIDSSLREDTAVDLAHMQYCCLWGALWAWERHLGTARGTNCLGKAHMAC